MSRQRELRPSWWKGCCSVVRDALDRPFAQDWEEAVDESGRLRVVIDQVASLTDASAVTRHAAVRG